MKILSIQDRKWSLIINEVFKNKSIYCDINDITMKDIKSSLVNGQYHVVIIDISCENSISPPEWWSILSFLKRYKNLVKIGLSSGEMKSCKETFDLDEFFIKGNFDSLDLISTVNILYDQKFSPYKDNSIYIENFHADSVDQMANTINNQGK